MTIQSQDHPIGVRSIIPEQDVEQKEAPRLGRRESEPHSHEIMYLYDVLSHNLPNGRVFPDLYHSFKFEKPEKGKEKEEVIFDISVFLNFQEPREKSSYKAEDYANRVPDMAINVLSKSTWEKDLLQIVDKCLLFKIPYYLVFAPYDVATKQYKPPFLRIYKYCSDGFYEEFTIRAVASVEGKLEINFSNIFDPRPEFPFLIGLQQLKSIHESGSKRFRVIFIDPEKRELLLTRFEEEKKRAEKYKELLRKHNIPIDD